jgi:hypothetical protein
MGRVLTFDKEKLFNYLTQLTATGEPIPTLRVIRDYLGGGSYTSIRNAIKEWKSNFPENSKIELPKDAVSLEQKLLVFDAALLALQPMVEEVITRYRNQLDARMKQLEEDAAALAAENEELQQQIEEGDERRVRELQAQKERYEQLLLLQESKHNRSIVEINKQLTERFSRQMEEQKEEFFRQMKELLKNNKQLLESASQEKQK